MIQTEQGQNPETLTSAVVTKRRRGPGKQDEREARSEEPFSIRAPALELLILRSAMNLSPSHDQKPSLCLEPRMDQKWHTYVCVHIWDPGAGPSVCQRAHGDAGVLGIILPGPHRELLHDGSDQLSVASFLPTM